MMGADQHRASSFVIVLLFALSCVLKSHALQAKPQTKPQSTKKMATLLVDADDACHLFIDNEDKGIVTPDSSSKFDVGPGEHLLKCKNDSIPDLMWRKAIEVKDTSQVVAVVSLKALHIQYEQAVTKALNQKVEEEDAAAKQLAEAEAAQKQQARAKAEFPKQIFDVVKGAWGYSSVVGSATAVDTTLTFKDLDASRGVLNFLFESMGRTYAGGKKPIVGGRRYSGYFTPSPPNRLESTILECSQTETQSAIKGNINYIPCSPTVNKFSFVVLVLTRDQLKLLGGNLELLLARKSQ